MERKNSVAYRAWFRRLSPEAQAVWVKSEGLPAAKDGRSSIEKPIPSVGSGYDWRAMARRRGLTEAEVARLDRDKLLIEDLAFSQSFEIYTASRGPVFITSDSLINGFQVLFEDSFRELEIHRAAALRSQLEQALKRARKELDDRRNGFPRADLAAGWRQAQWGIGPALRLLGTPAEIFDADVRDEIERLVELIRRAEGESMPAQLGPPSATLLGIDYRRFKPVGFYAGPEVLQNYFRAVRWLQTIPFRADRDNELTAIGLLGYGAGFLHGDWFRDYSAFPGRPDALSLADATEEFQNFLAAGRNIPDWKTRLASVRRELLRKAPRHPLINDQDRLAPAAGDPLAEIQFRVLASQATPDAVVLDRLAPRGGLPSGLAVAAMLGSEFARAQITSIPPAQLESAVQSAREAGSGARASAAVSSLYENYLDALAALALPPEPEAPAFMRGQPWAAKSCLTIMAGWAQLRHTFTLQAKEDVFYFGLQETQAGFIEPNPEFFHRFGNVCVRAIAELERQDTFVSVSAGQKPRETDEDEVLPSYAISLRRRWEILHDLARRLEAMAHKELRQKTWSDNENGFLRAYGAELAAVMGYFGNSYEKPRDDAPRSTVVASNPARDELLAVAIGRPRILHVLYPWQGGEILCEGSVLPYYEAAQKTRLTDAEWLTRLDAKPAPVFPAWLAPYIAK